MSLDLKELDTRVKTALSLSEIKIATNEENAKAAVILRGLRGLKQTVKDTFRPHIETAHKAWKSLIASEKEHLAPIEQVESILEDKIKEFIRAEEQKRIEAQRKIDELARKEAEKERARLEKQAEKLSAKGKMDEAEAKLQEAQTVTAVAPIVESKAEKQEGISTVKVPKFIIENEALLPREYLMPNEQAIRKVVNALKENTKIPGVKVWIEEDLRVRR